MFGRGRGRGVPPGARLRDDDGRVISLNPNAAPPELFPPLGRPLPTLPVLTSRDEELLKHKRALDAHWRTSCFNLPLPTAASTGTADGGSDDAEVERYSDRVRRAQAPPRPVSLHEVVGRLESRYFPRELWATRKHSAGAARRLADVHGGAGGSGAGDIARLDRLADAEQRATARPAPGGGDEDIDDGGMSTLDEDAFVDARTQSRKRVRAMMGVGNIDDDDDDAQPPRRQQPSRGADREDDGPDGPDGDGDVDDDEEEDDFDLERFDDDDGYEDGSFGGGDDDGAVY